jgi:hypothetical protein
MTKLNNDDFAKICIAVDRFREHLGRDEAINTINAIIAKRWTIAPSDDDAIISENARLRDLLDSANHEGGSLMWTSDHEKIVARIEMTAQKVHMKIREILDAGKRGPQ